MPRASNQISYSYEKFERSAVLHYNLEVTWNFWIPRVLLDFSCKTISFRHTHRILMVRIKSNDLHLCVILSNLKGIQHEKFPSTTYVMKPFILQFFVNQSSIYLQIIVFKATLSQILFHPCVKIANTWAPYYLYRRWTSLKMQNRFVLLLR